MMLTLNDGRTELWQWDTGRTLAVDADCSQVHFSNKVFGRSIDVDVIDGAAIIPDVLLQTDKELNVWAFVGTAENGYTKISKTFKVNRRNKPADYVFTPTDQITLQTIQSQIGDLDDLTTEAKENLVAAINEAARTGGVDVSGAQVGQTIRVSAVDENGKPTEWEAADMTSGVQPDWNQNDGTQQDYVKNRPFYTGAPAETVLVKESTVSFAPENGVYMGQLKLTFLPTVGETYKVSWDGIVYECTSVSVEGRPVIGNLAIIGGGSDTGEPFIMGIQNGERIIIFTTDTSVSHTFSISGLAAEIVKIDAKYLPLPFKPDGISYLTFSSRNSFSLRTEEKKWDGTIEYFASDETWTVWDGASSLSAEANGSEYVLYLRGTGNTVISNSVGWNLEGFDISCIGNIETLLDYATVESGGHPVMAASCYRHMFQDCTNLTRAPELPAATLANYCYDSMFKGCTNLTQAPALPATTLATDCYYSMFRGCTSLTKAPELPATTLVSRCYYRMFRGCTSLTKAPELPATTLTSECYCDMFRDCTNLIQAPALPATTLAEYCYLGMFQGCTSLKLSSTQTGEYAQEYRIPSSGDGVTAQSALSDMFTSTGGTFTGTPSINTTYYLSSDNMIVRETEIATLNGYVRSMIDSAGERIPVPATAEVGQTVVVKAVDENGKPTEWEAADMASGADGKSAYAYAVEGGYTGTEAEFAAKLAEEMPDALPNPNALTFTGAVTGTYDGSAPVSVEIPSGGGGRTLELIADVTTAEETTMISITKDSDGNPLSIKSWAAYIYIPAHERDTAKSFYARGNSYGGGMTFTSMLISQNKDMGFFLYPIANYDAQDAVRVSGITNPLRVQYISTGFHVGDAATGFGLNLSIFQVYTNNTEVLFPAGVRVRLWGVRT